MLYLPILLSYTDPLVIVGSLKFNQTSLTLTCTSSGRPVDSFTWLKDGTEVGSEFS